MSEEDDELGKSVKIKVERRPESGLRFWSDQTNSASRRDHWLWWSLRERLWGADPRNL